jgi:MFS family permease
VLLVCLLGTAGSFALLAVADSINEIYLARALGGFFGASIGTAQAYMTDITNPENRARGMGLIGAAFGIGFVLGNLLGGTLQTISPGLPFYTTAALALAAFLIAIFFLPESRSVRDEPVSWGRVGRSLIPAPVLLAITAHSNRTRLYLYLFFHIFLSFSALEAMFALYSSETFGWDEWDVGLFLAYFGIVMGVTQGLLIGRFTDRFGEVPLVLAGLALTGVTMILMPFSPSGLPLIVIGGLMAFGNGLAFPAFTSLFTQVCDADEAGETLGQSQAMAQTGRTIGALGSGWVFQTIAPGAPFFLGGVGMLVGLVLFGVSLRVLVPRTPPETAPGTPET